VQLHPQLTYPLDTLRLRLAVDPSVVGMRGAARILMAEGSGLAFYRGIGVAMLGRWCPAALLMSGHDTGSVQPCKHSTWSSPAE
jgi:hypothetical protein